MSKSEIILVVVMDEHKPVSFPLSSIPATETHFLRVVLGFK